MSFAATSGSGVSALVGAVVVGGIWVFTCWRLAKMGWQRLGEGFATTSSPKANARQYAERTVRIKGARYEPRYIGKVNIWIDDEGVDIHPRIWVRPFHRNLRIKLRDIAALRHDPALSVTPYVVHLHGNYPDIWVDDAVGAALADGRSKNANAPSEPVPGRLG